MIIKPLIYNHEVGILVLITINIMLVFLFMIKFNKKLRIIFYGSLSARLIIMLVDIYLRDYIPIPHSGADTENFLSRAIEISESFQAIVESNHEFFIKSVATLFRITANERLIAQYTNVLLGFTVVYLICLILNMLEVNLKNKQIGLLFASFFPTTLFFSGILLREMVSTFFVVATIYFLIKWYLNTKALYFYMSILMILIGALFHSGVVVFLLAHLFILLFYNRKSNELEFSFGTVISFALISLFAIWFFGIYEWTNLAIFRKLQIENVQDVLGASQSRSGGSAYLIGLSINSIYELIIYTPIFVIFFVSSPLPINWRGFYDIFSFLFDGLIYLLMSVYIIFNIKSKEFNYKSLSIILSVGLLGVLIIFGIGVQNAGTAVRHRHKVFHVFLILCILIKDKKEAKFIDKVHIIV